MTKFSTKLRVLMVTLRVKLAFLRFSRKGKNDKFLSFTTNYEICMNKKKIQVVILTSQTFYIVIINVKVWALFYAKILSTIQLLNRWTLTIWILYLYQPTNALIHTLFSKKKLKLWFRDTVDSICMQSSRLLKSVW